MASTAALMSDPIVQAKLLGTIVFIENALREKEFMKLVHELTGATSSSFRFYMKGSSAARLNLSTSFPTPLTSDIDMVLLIDPTLSVRTYRVLRALLVNRLLDACDAVISKSVGFFGGRSLVPANNMKFSIREFNGPLKDDLSSYISETFANPSIKAPDNAGLIYKFINNFARPGADGVYKLEGFSHLKFVPRLVGDPIDSVLDIMIPSHDYKGVYYDWAATERLVNNRINLGSGTTLEVKLLDPYMLIADLRKTMATESRPEKRAGRAKIISMLEVAHISLV